MPSGDARQMPHPPSAAVLAQPGSREGKAGPQANRPNLRSVAPYLDSGGVRSRRAIQIGAAAMAFVVVIGAVVVAVVAVGRLQARTLLPHASRPARQPGRC